MSVTESGVGSEGWPSSTVQQVYLDTFTEEMQYLIKFIDTYNNVVANQDTFLTASVSGDTSVCGSESAYIAGKTVAQSELGVAILRFTSSCYPLGVLALSITATDLGDAASSLALELQFRGCRRGEYYSAGSCYVCPNGTYSLQSNDKLNVTSCSTCPSHATCYGAVITIDPGYWRISENASNLLECPISSACLGK
jgi:hypothetical protein